MSISNTIRAGAAYVEVTAETSKLQRNLTSAQAQLQAFGRTCTTVGKDLLMFSGAMALPLVMAAKSFAGFDDSMRLVQAVTQATDNDFKALTVTAQQLGRETSFTAQQVADAMVSLGRMGFSPTEIQKAIADVLNLSRATGTELAEAGDIAANSLRIFRLEAEKMSDVSDVLTVTANSSAQTLTDLFEALKMGGPQAAAAGESIRETCASLAILANLGIKGSLAGTALRKSFSQFAKVKVQDQLRSVGVETLDANGNLRKMAEIMRDIAKVMQTMPTAEKLAFAEDIFDIRGSLAGLTLTANTDELDAMMAKLLDVEGVAADTAQKMDAGLGGSFRLLMSAVEGAMNAIAAAMNGTLQPLITKVTGIINVFTQWIERNQGLVTAFAVVVAGAATLGVALIAIGVAAKGVTAGLAVVQTVTKGFAFVQGLCIAQATAMKSSILLIGQAFANYRNLAIPAMVGTEKFCMALGLVSTAANRTRASIILMSNAEAAAAAKSFLAAKWQAMTSALSAFRDSALAAAIATKAQGAAELALGARSAVVNGWLAMTNALRGMTLASVSATVALKAQAVVEGAMNAGRSITASWVAMTAALKDMTLASVGTVIALKAQAAAEAVCTASTAALNAVRSAGIAIVTAFTAVNLKSVIATGAVTAGNFLLATAAKVAAGAMLALSAVMSFIAAHPVAIALIALTAILGGVCIALYKAGNYTAKLSDEASRLREKGDELRRTDQVRMERLQQLAQKQKLTNAEMAEARILAGKLQKKYGNLGISVTDNAMRIKALSEAVSTLEALELKVHDNGELQKIQRLKELSLKVNLSVDEQNEAKFLLDDLSSKYGELGLSMDAASGRIVALTTAQLRFAQAHERIKGGSDPMKEVHLSQLERLKKLASQEKLTADEQREAQNILTSLNGAYNNLGLGIDFICGKLNVATDAQKKFNNAMKESALAQLDAEIAEYKSNIQELQRENESLDSHRNHNLVSQLSGRQDEALRKQAANLDRILVLRQKIAATQKRRKAVQAEKKEAYTGEKAPAVPTTEDKVRQERTRSSKDQELVANAESRVKEIEKRLKRERQTDLENEIEDIIALRDEYKKLIQTMLTFEKSKKNSDKQKIADLEKKLAQADKTAEERIAKAKEKEAQKLQKDVSSYKERFAETEKSVKERRAEEKTDRELDKQLETDPDAGAERLKQLIAQYQKAATDAKAQFQLELTSAQKDGKIDDTERGKIDAAMQAYSRAESMVDKYSAKLNSAQKGTQEASEDVENTRQIGSFLAASLDSMLGGSSDSTRTANATEMVAKYSKETNRLLKKMNMQNSTSSLTYT